MGLEDTLHLKENFSSMLCASEAATNILRVYKNLAVEIAKDYGMNAKIARSKVTGIRQKNWLDAKACLIELSFTENNNLIASVQSNLVYGIELRTKNFRECEGMADYFRKILMRKTEKEYSLEEKILVYSEAKGLFDRLVSSIKPDRRNYYNAIGTLPSYELPEKPKEPELEIPSAANVKELLDKSVIGQESAKSDIIIAARNHYLALKSNKDNNTSIEKSCILLMGPTGCGKTLLVKNIVKAFNVPYAIGDATDYTSHGYVGDDIEKIFAKLFLAAKGNMELAEKGIIFLDEFDKIRTKASSWGKDVNGEEVQSALLTKIEGGEADISRYVSSPPRPMKTKDIFLIFGGSFLGLEEVIKGRLREGSSRIGFGSEYCKKEILSKATISDLVEFGIKRELVGRCPIIVSLNELSLEEMRRILTEPENSLVTQYKQLAAMHGLELEFEEDALMQVAGLAKGKNLGARAIKSVMHDVTKELFYSGHTGKFTITKDYVTKNAIK